MEDQTRRLVFVGDPALDVREMRIRGPGGYGETRDPGLVRPLPSRTPVWFTVRHLTPRESIVVDERQTPLRKSRQALCMALVSVEIPNGPTMRPTESVVGEKGAEKLIWNDEGLDLLIRRFGKLCMLDIGTAILELDEQLGEAFGGSGVVRFTLLPSSLLALEQTERQLAAQTPIGPTTPS